MSEAKIKNLENKIKLNKLKYDEIVQRQMDLEAKDKSIGQENYSEEDEDALYNLFTSIQAYTRKIEDIKKNIRNNNAKKIKLNISKLMETVMMAEKDIREAKQILENISAYEIQPIIMNVLNIITEVLKELTNLSNLDRVTENDLVNILNALNIALNSANELIQLIETYKKNKENQLKKEKQNLNEANKSLKISKKYKNKLVKGLSLISSTNNFMKTMKQNGGNKKKKNNKNKTKKRK